MSSNAPKFDHPCFTNAPARAACLAQFTRCRHCRADAIIDAIIDAEE